MQKRSVPVVIAVILILAFAPVSLSAGTLMVGGKAWFALWDSEWGQKLAELADFEIATFYSYLTYGTYTDAKATSKAETGKGFLAGPLVSYQTDDRLWTMSLAVMWFSSFSQDIKSTFYDYNLAASLPFKYDLKLSRKEIDVAVARSLTENLRIFAGFKRQSLENNFTATVEGTEYKVYDVNLDVNIPTAGLGFAVPISESVVVGIQAGVLYAMSKFKYKDYLTNYKDSIKMENTIGYNAEAALTFLVAESIAIQAGYRYQYMKFEFDDPEYPGMPKIKDTFHGITVSAVYMIPIGG